MEIASSSQKWGHFCDLQEFAQPRGRMRICRDNMSNRNEILPGAAVWDSFYDKNVQLVLETRRHAPALDARIPQDARLEFLAWPIIAHCAVDGLVQDDPNKVRRQVAFLDAYAQDPAFVSSLLAELTDFHLIPDDKKSLTRKIEEVSNQCRSADIDAWFASNGVGSDECLGLHDWKTIAEIIGCKNSPAQLKTEFHREKRRRQGIRSRWEENFQAWEKLSAWENGNHTLLPLKHVSVRD